jgi:asparagine synthase (glutamine-hydrolysing)
MTDAAQLLSVLRSSMRNIAGEEEVVAVAYSGGLDSSIVVALAKELTRTTGYTCAIPGSFDDKHVAEAAQHDGMGTKTIHLTDAELTEYVKRTASVLGTLNPSSIAYTIPIICVLDNCEEDLLLVGSGADELFGGYAKYQASTDPEAAMSSDLVKMMAEAQLLQTEAAKVGKRIGFPFTDEAVVMAALNVPVQQKVDISGRKLILREVGRVLSLHSADRPKKAAQYSSGVLKEMERLAGAQKLDLHDWTTMITSRKSL